jgi:hypothetical protein
MKQPWYLAAVSYVCETCGAGPGEPCLSRNLRTCALPHSDRTDQAASNDWHTSDEADFR